jgi:hypothetical protein
MTRGGKGVLILEIFIMRNLISVTLLVALLGGRPTIAQTVGSVGPAVRSTSATVPESSTQDTRLIGAPVGHRQPSARDVPSQDGLDRLSEEDVAVDRKLHICRGC